MIDLEGHIWCRLRCTPPGHWKSHTHTVIPEQVHQGPQSRVETPPPLPHTLHIGHHTTMNGGGACVGVCVASVLGGAPRAHPRTTPGPEVPVCHSLYCLRACAWARSMHTWACKRERWCEQEEAHGAAETSQRHTYDETQSSWLTESGGGGATEAAVIVFKESKSQHDLPIRWGHSSSHIDFWSFKQVRLSTLVLLETGSVVYLSVCVRALALGGANRKYRRQTEVEAIFFLIKGGEWKPGWDTIASLKW